MLESSKRTSVSRADEWEVGEVVIYLTGSQIAEGLIPIESPLVWEDFGGG